MLDRCFGLTKGGGTLSANSAHGAAHWYSIESTKSTWTLRLQLVARLELSDRKPLPDSGRS